MVQLLKAAAPTVSQLNLFHPRLQHLKLLRNMRQLKRLDLCNDWSHDVLYDEEDWDLDQFGDWQAGQGLKRLRVRGDRGLPRTMLWYLLRAHNATLEELELQVEDNESDRVSGQISTSTTLWTFPNLSRKANQNCRVENYCS